jgi:hypothetical protein
MALVLVASVIMTGCGGGAQQNNSSQDSKDSKQGSKDSKQGSKAKTTNQKSTTEQEENRQSLSGMVVVTLPDKDKIIIRPHKAKVVKIKYKPESVDVTLQGKQVEPDAISVGQQATVSFVKRTNNNSEVNLARSIWLQPGSGANQGSETTG